MAADDVAVEVVYAAAPHRVTRVSLRLPAGATVSQAIRASGVVEQLPADELARLEAGVWGRVVPGDTVLHDGDRVELTRPLCVDPKEARRLRYRRDRATPDKRRAAVSGNRSR
jgi:uncharacterized protein